MGFKTEFNWALKLKPEQGLDENKIEIDKIYSFNKDEYRIYPVDMPIDLLNKNWEAIGRVIIVESTNKENKTIGKYKVLKIYETEEKELLSKYWKKK
jgi:hypothetical protein